MYDRIAVQPVHNVHLTYCAHKMHAFPHGHVDFNRPTRMLYTNAGCLELFLFQVIRQRGGRGACVHELSILTLIKSYTCWSILISIPLSACLS